MLSDFFKGSNGQLSHTRLISIFGSFSVFVVFIIYPKDQGIQNLIAIIISGSLINATASKFAGRINRKRTRSREDNHNRIV